MREDWRSSPTKRFQAATIAALGFPVIAALGSTYRWRVEGRGHFDSAFMDGHRPIMAFWHGRILPATLYFRDRGIVVITSENFDGEWIARIIERFGYGTARGSSSRGGMKALIRLKRDMQQGRPAAFTLDGPRGPVKVAQPGAVWLARATGNPIIPFHIEADRHWTTGSWDATQVPKPYSTIAVAIGDPLWVPASASDEEVEDRRAELETRLRGLEERALTILGG